MKLLKTFNYKKLIAAPVEQTEMSITDEQQPQEQNPTVLPGNDDNQQQSVLEEDIPEIPQYEIEKNLADDFPEDEAPNDVEDINTEENVLPSMEDATLDIPEFGNASQAVSWAMKNNKVLKVNYTTLKGGNINRVIEPHHIFQARTGNVLVVSYDRSVAGGTRYKHEKIKGVARSRAKPIRNFIIDHINSYVFTGNDFKIKFKVLPSELRPEKIKRTPNKKKKLEVLTNKEREPMDTNIFTKLNNIGNELESGGMIKSAEIITDVMKNLIQIKEAQYVGVQGYWIRNGRCWSNCYRHKRTAKPKLAAQEVFSECWEEYLKALDTNDTSTWDKYASIDNNIKTSQGLMDTTQDVTYTNTLEDEMADGGFGEMNQGFATEDPAENDITPELMQKMTEYAQLIESGQGNSEQARFLQTELISKGLLSDPSIKEFKSNKKTKTAKMDILDTNPDVDYTNTMEDEIAGGGFGEINQGFTTEDPAENEITPELIEKMKEYSQLIESGQGNSEQARFLQSELISKGLLSDPSIKEFKSNKAIKNASSNFVKTVKANVKEGVSLPEAVYAKINEEIEKTSTDIIENVDTLLSLSEVLADNGQKDLSIKIANISVELLKQADFGRGTTKGKGKRGGFKNLIQRGWDWMRGRSEGGSKEIDLVIRHLRGMLNRINVLLQKIQFGNKEGSSKIYNYMKMAAPGDMNWYGKDGIGNTAPQEPVTTEEPAAAPAPVQQPPAKTPKLQSEVSMEFSQFVKDLGEEVSFLSGIAMKGQNPVAQQVAQSINNSLVNAQQTFQNSKGKGFSPRYILTMLTKLRTDVINSMVNMQKPDSQQEQISPESQPGDVFQTEQSGQSSQSVGQNIIDLDKIESYDLPKLLSVKKTIDSRVAALQQQK